MKKSVLDIVVVVILLGLFVHWLMHFYKQSDLIDQLLLLVLVVMVLYYRYNNSSSEKRGLPSEDEFSKKVLQKAAALSFYLSPFLWLVIMVITNRTKTETDVMFGWGLLGMFVIFGLSWVYFNFKGIKNE